MPKTTLLPLIASILGLAGSMSAAPASTAEPAPVKLENMVVTAAPFGRSQSELAQATSVLEGQALGLRRQSTLGDTLSGEVGMAATAFGPGSSRPIIRGLGGDRVRILENGVGTLDASVISPDHAVSVEPFQAERIEVVRGPASLLYGGTAVGGVVNVITHRIHSELPEKREEGLFALSAGGPASEWTRSGIMDTVLQRGGLFGVVLHLDGFKRESGDLRIPGWAESAARRAAEASEEGGTEAHDEQSGRLANSFVHAEGASAGLSFIAPRVSFGLSYGGYNTQYGVPGHEHHHEEAGADAHAGAAQEPVEEGVHIDLRQRRVDGQAEWRPQSSWLKSVRAKVGRAEYTHTEFEDGVSGTVFENRGVEARLEAAHTFAGNQEGAVGYQGLDNTFAAAGEEAFLPPSKTHSHALFAFEELKLGSTTLQAGARWERQTVKAATERTRRADNSVCGSVGLVHSLSDAYTLAASLSRTGRAPNSQELYADGPHTGTSSYEIGDATLPAERSLGAEVSLRRVRGTITGALTLHCSTFDDFIFERPTSEVAVERNGSMVVVPTFSLGRDESGMPVYRFTGSDARFWGAELEACWHLHNDVLHSLDVTFGADIVRGRESGGPGWSDLPRMPAARLLGGIDWRPGRWTLGIDFQAVQRQTHTATGESVTPGYALVGAHLIRTFSLGRIEGRLQVKAGNLLDEEARPHTSFLKDRVPLGARSVSFGVVAAF